jgi:hypothetical protein
VHKAWPIAVIVLAAALCGAPRDASAQDEQPRAGATDAHAQPESGKSDREPPAEADSKQDEDSPEIACIRELAASEEAFQSKLDAKALSEADAEKLIQLLDDADAACGEGDVRGAREKLETVNETVAKAK